MLSSRGVSDAAFCHLGLLSHPLLLLFLAWVSSFGVCSGLGWKAGSCLGSSRLFFFLGGGGGGLAPSLVLIVFAWMFQLFCCPGFLSFLELFCWGSFLSLPVFADSSGWLADSPLLSALRCLAAGGVTLIFSQGPVGLP